MDRVLTTQSVGGEGIEDHIKKAGGGCLEFSIAGCRCGLRSGIAARVLVGAG